MFSLLNRFAFFLSLAVASIPLTIDWEFFPLSIVIFLVMKLAILSTESIRRAVEDYSTSARIDTTPIENISESAPIESTDTTSQSIMTENLEPRVALDERVPENISPEPITQIETTIPSEPSRFSLWFHAFFADRPLAKVGGILLFLGALFFLWLIFDAVGPVGKILIGIGFGFSLIGIGVWLDKKSIETESRVLIGIGIAVNYLTILSGRHLLSTGLIAGEPLFSDIFATILLLLNTVFAIVLALVYRSRVLLSFAFVFAYLTPMLVGSEESSIFLLSVYVSLVTIAASILIVFYKKNTLQDASLLHGIATVGMTILFALASVSIETTGEYTALFVGVCISGVALVLSVLDNHKNITAVFVGMYIIVLMSLFSESIVLLPVFLVLVFAGIIWAFFAGILSVIVVSLFGICSFLFGLFAFWIVGPTFLLSLLWLSFFVFVLLASVIIRSSSLVAGGVGIIGYGMILLLGLFTVDVQDVMTQDAVFATKISAIFLLISASTVAIFKRDARIYLLASIMSGILLIFPDTFYGYFGISLISAIVYAVLALVVPYMLLVRGGLISQTSLLVTFPIASIVIAYSIYQVGHERFPGLILGLTYIVQAIVTLIYAVVLHSYFRRIETTFTSLTRNTLLILFAVPLSLFTFALAFVFRDIPAVMSLAWVIESAILYLIAVRMGDSRIFVGAHIILFLGLAREVALIDSFFTRDWVSFGLILIMGAAIMASLIILRDEDSNMRKPYDILHILAIIILGFGISEIVLSTSTGWSILSLSLFALVLGMIYRLYGSMIQHIFLTILYAGVCVYFIGDFTYLNKDEFLPLIVQWMALGVLVLTGMMRGDTLSTQRPLRVSIAVIAGLVVSSFYVDEFFGTFAVSIYLAIIATVCIIVGIQKSLPRYRTIGLYIGIFVLLKILFYDIWYTSGDLIVRVIALMVTGGLMIYLSQLYGKHVSRGWSEELDIANILPSKKLSEMNVENEIVDEKAFDSTLENELASTDISDISAVRFVQSSGTEFTLRRAGVIKIARYIVSCMGKQVFAPGELSSIFAGVIPHLQSTLSQKDLESLLTKIESWIAEGGSVEFTRKNK